MPRPRRDTWLPLKEIALHGLVRDEAKGDAEIFFLINKEDNI
jgi:hypothetical protein